MSSPPQFPVATPLDLPASPHRLDVAARTRVAVIDDNRRDIELFIIACDIGGIAADITGYASGLAALTALKAQALESRDLPAVIMLDLNMPGMNGFDVLTALKAHDALRAVPVVILTSSNSPRDRDQCQRMGAGGYLVKPSTINEFVTMLKEALPASPA